MNPKIAGSGVTFSCNRTHFATSTNILQFKNAFWIFPGPKKDDSFPFSVKLFPMLLYSRPRAGRLLLFDETLKVLSSWQSPSMIRSSDWSLPPIRGLWLVAASHPRPLIGHYLKILRGCELCVTKLAELQVTLVRISFVMDRATLKQELEKVISVGPGISINLDSCHHHVE